MSSKDYINFLITFDAGYLVQATTTMVSVIKNLNRNYKARFFLFTTGLNDSDLAQLNEMDCEIVNIDVTKYLNVFNEVDTNDFANSYINLAGNYRLLMFDILPEYVKKIIYLDCDIIVNNDLSIVYNQLTEDKLIAVVVEIWAMQHRKTILKHCYEMEEFVNFQKDSYLYPYFNSGFLVVNLEKAKEYKIGMKINEFIKKHPKLPYYDQDTLNAIITQEYNKDIMYLEPSWNVFCDIDYTYNFDDAYYTEREIKKAFNDPYIFHFCGVNKPWKNSISHYYYKWWYYFFKSPFKNNDKLKIKYHKIQKELKPTYIKLFGLIPLLKIVGNFNKKYIKLLNVIPLLKIERNKKNKDYRLFNFILLLRIRSK